MKLAFIGLGQMGSGIARNLLRAGHQVTAFNRSRAKAEALRTDGAQIAGSPADAVREAEVVMTMLADDHAVEEVVFGERGIAAGMTPNAVHVSHSTISTAMARRLAEEHARRGQRYLSAPVFGRPEAAEAKRLLVVVAGDHTTIEQCRPLLDAIGRQTFALGSGADSEPWTANAVKLCGNFMIASMLETFGEAFAALRKAGVEPQAFLEIMNALFASPVYANYGRIIAEERFEPAGFALKLGLKDVRLALALAEECGAPMPLASLIRDQMISAMAHGQAEADWSSVARTSARSAGLRAGTRVPAADS
jgi:3-hydroxyisobutyrate dehydrogenase-like beta-hydroxyacid dehydrogenase